MPSLRVVALEEQLLQLALDRQPLEEAGLGARLHRALHAADGAARLVRRRELSRVVEDGVGEASGPSAPPRPRPRARSRASWPRRSTSGGRWPSARSRAPCRRAAPAAACRRCRAARRARLPAGRSCRASFRAMRMSAASATSSPPPDRVAVERRDHELRRLLEPRQRLVRVQAEVVLELGIRVLEHRRCSRRRRRTSRRRRGSR